jgi:hypothetical protein
MDAAAAVAAELDAERQQAACINNRLRFAEDKILQQVCARVTCQHAFKVVCLLVWLAILKLCLQQVFAGATSQHSSCLLTWLVSTQLVPAAGCVVKVLDGLTTEHQDTGSCCAVCCVLQEAELVRLQGSASAARRRIKSATAATLQELLDRYGGAAAAWTQQQQGASSPSSGR